MSNTRFCLTVTGESLRNLVALRIKDYRFISDRHEKALAKLRADLVELEKQPPAAPAPRRARAIGRPLPGLLGQYVDTGHDIEQDMLYVQNQISACEFSLEATKMGMQRAQWLHDNVITTKTYDLGTEDLSVLGFAAGGINQGLAISNDFIV